jgi:MFS transporter, AAHS family, vanillate permease
MVLVWANIGGAIGAIGVSLLTRRFDVRFLAMACLLLSALLVTLFGLVPANPVLMAGVACGAGVCTNGAVVAIYALIANCYPVELRAGGTGVIIGIGRGTAALGPVIAGFLFNAGVGLLLVSVVMAAGSLVAAGALQRLPRRPQSLA